MDTNNRQSVECFWTYFYVILVVLLFLTVPCSAQQNWTGDSFTYKPKDFINLGPVVEGRTQYCRDCDATKNPCQGGGTGAWIFGSNGMWLCAIGGVQNPAGSPLFYGASGKPATFHVVSSTTNTITVDGSNDIVPGETIDIWDANALSLVTAPLAVGSASAPCAAGSNTVSYAAAAVQNNGGVGPATFFNAGSLAGTGSTLTAINCAAMSFASGGGTAPQGYLLWRDTTGGGAWVLVGFITGGFGPTTGYTSGYHDAGQYSLSAATSPFPLTPTTSNNYTIFQTLVTSVNGQIITLKDNIPHAPLAGSSVWRDATAAIQNAANDSLTGDVQVPAGTYLLSSDILLPDKFSFHGVGPSTVILRAPWWPGTVNDGLLSASVGGSSVSFKDFTIEDSPVKGSPAFNGPIKGDLIWGNGTSRVSIENVNFRDVDSKPISDNAAIDASWTVKNNKANNLYWRGFMDVVFSANSSNPAGAARLHVIGNTITNNHGDDIFDSNPVDGSEYTGNVLTTTAPLNKCATGGVGNVGIWIAGIHVSATNNFVYANCGIGIYAAVGGDTTSATTRDINISGNHVMEETNTVISGPGIQVGNATEVNINNNSIQNNNPISGGIVLAGSICGKIKVSNNSIYNHSGTTGSGRISVNCDNTVVENNYAEAVAVSSTSFPIGTAGTNGATVRNNTLYGFNAATGSAAALGAVQGTNPMFNILFANNNIISPAATGTNYDIYLTGTINNATAIDNTILNTDPTTGNAYQVGTVNMTNLTVKHRLAVISTFGAGNTQQPQGDKIFMTGGGPITMLDPSIFAPGKELYVINQSGSNVTLIHFTGSTINGAAADYVIPSATIVHLVARGSDWSLD